MRRLIGLWVAAGIVVAAAASTYGQARQGTPGGAIPATGRGNPAENSPGRTPAKGAQKPQAEARKDPAKPAPPPPDPKRMEELLKAWEHQSAQNKSLDVLFTRVDTSAVWNDKITYVGRAALKSPNRAFLQFEKVVSGKKQGETKNELFEVIMCNGDKVYQFLYERKQVFVYPLDARERQRALQEGPLPFLFDMKSEEAKKRYEFTLLGENEAKCLIQIIPRQNIDREAFSAAFIWLDKQTFMPTRLQLNDPNNGKDKKEFTFTKLKTNVEIAEGLFSGEELSRRVIAKNGWKRIDNPDSEGNAQGAPRPKANAGRPMQPAARTAAERRR